VKNTTKPILTCWKYKVAPENYGLIRFIQIGALILKKVHIFEHINRVVKKF